MLCAALLVSSTLLAQSPSSGAPSSGAPSSGARPLVYVTDITAPTPALAKDAAAITTSLCGMIAKDTRVEVLCAPDVKQILSFAAMGALAGTDNPATRSLTQRMEKVDHVVGGTLTSATKDGVTVYTLVVSAGKNAEGADAMTPYFDTAIVRFEETSTGKSNPLLARLPELVQRTIKALLAPLVPPATPPTTPPEPLAPSKKP